MRLALRLFCRFVCGLLLAAMLLGCAGSMTLESLHALNPAAYAGRICAAPKALPPDTRFLAYQVATNTLIGDQDRERLEAFAKVADSIHEVSADAPRSSASTLPRSVGLSCVDRGGLPSPAEVEAEKARLAMPAELRATLTAILAQSCAEKARPDPRYVGQTHRDNLLPLEYKLVIAVLKWAVENPPTPEQAPAAPQARQILPLPPLVVQKPVAQDEALSLEDPAVQFGGGLAAGAAAGAVPLGATTVEVGIQLRLLPNGTYWARVGRACGEIGVGVGQIALGCAGMGAGAGMTSTGGGAVVGVPVIAESFAIAINGCATAANGVRNAGELFREGAPPEAAPPPSQVKLLEPKPKPATQAPSATTTTTRVKDASGRTAVTIKKSSNGTVTTTRTKPKASGAEPQSAAPKATAPYTRPSGATTTAQRASVQGKPCVDCGKVAPRQVADHKMPLVKEHYQTGNIDKTRMRSNDAVQPQCPTCSARQGAEMSQYSREQRQRLKDTAP
ncbi:MAG: hypothetical protein IPM54_28250 [Polyangiaceae bacterium]|nr:hypothetical protein [Polyangiaceae bacterium]